MRPGNVGMGLIGKMRRTNTFTKWCEERGRHAIFAGGKKVSMFEVGHKLTLNAEQVDSEANHTLDELGIAKKARDGKQNVDAESARMARLNREYVLVEKPIEGLISLDRIAPAKPAREKEVTLSPASNFTAYSQDTAGPPDGFPVDPLRLIGHTSARWAVRDYAVTDCGSRSCNSRQRAYNPGNPFLEWRFRLKCSREDISFPRWPPFWLLRKLEARSLELR